MSTDKSRVDALTDETRATLAAAADVLETDGMVPARDELAKKVRAILAASPVDQSADDEASAHECNIDFGPGATLQPGPRVTFADGMREAARLIQLWQSMQPAYRQVHSAYNRDASRIIAFWPGRLREAADDSTVEQPAAAPPTASDAKWAAYPVARRALAESIEEVEALSNSEDRDLTVCETESMMLVLHELKRLQVIEREAVEIVARGSASQSAAAPIPYDGLTEEFVDEVARLCNDAPGSRNAVYAALVNCNAVVVPQSKTAPAPADERAAFEAWWVRDVPQHSTAIRRAMIRRGPDDRYLNDRCNDAWEACVWQRSRASSANETAVEGATDLTERAAR